MKSHYPSVVSFVEDLPRSINSITICGTSYSDTGGVARVIEQQANDLVKSGFEVEINILTGKKRDPNDAKVHQIGYFETTPYKELNKIITPVTPHGYRSLLRISDSDLVIAHRFPFSMLGYFVSRAQDDTTYVFWSHPSQSSDDLFDGVARAWARIQHYLETAHFTVRNADYICAVSEESRSYITSMTDREAIYVPNSVPDSRFSEKVSVKYIEDAYDIKPTDTIVLHVGRISPRKNIIELVKSFQSATEGDEGYKLVLVGKENMGEYSKTVRKKADENVIFTGFIDDDILAGFYERSDVYATCSLSEGWGLPLSEANRFGTPIVAYDSIPAVQSIENAILASDGEQADFEAKLASALQSIEAGELD